MTGAARAPYAALVLAASRGPDEPVARARGVSHKSLAPVAGVPMLVRVVRALAASDAVGHIAVSIEAPALLDAVPEVADAATVVASGPTPCRSILAAAAALEAPFPLLVTTADHALLTPEMVERFCRDAAASGAEVAIGLAAKPAVLGRYPETRRTFLAFRDGGYTGCNLYAFRSPAAMRAVEVWAGVEGQRKRPWRIFRAFGPAALALYLVRALTLDGAMRRVSRIHGLEVAAVTLPYPEAAIDVDRPADLELAERILAARG